MKRLTKSVIQLSVRVAYTLGGKGSGLAHNASELREIVTRALAQSRITQVLVEEYVGHWKEIEYEVVRDYADNCLTICNMENFDPMGVAYRRFDSCCAFADADES